jgi:hypothetical protein
MNVCSIGEKPFGSLPMVIEIDRSFLMYVPEVALDA